ncbi:hypothetical protein FA95DRAFT_1586553 [Auriscalpium vulgare]|uniref:Uncharacterized protein n=1 Tax=Auriscalpium vulgare TaxID=40419 RepID=A0ACB8S901_9AGAM|nr:hypothetical protein FA95DRAFT_1586553 [Auriscalpium vulgare]
MSPAPFALRIQHGITGGFAPPRPSAVHEFSLEPSSQFIALTSQIRDHGTPTLLAHPSKSVHVSDETTALVNELQTILKRLPTENPPSTDIYQQDIGIFWQGSDGFSWFNAAPSGCGGFESDVKVTDDDKKAFGRAIEITEDLVSKGVAKEIA